SEEFTRRVSFFDHSNHRYFCLPIQPLAQLPATLGSLSPPFFVHVREPEYSSVSLIAKYFIRARVTPMDLGLCSFRSYQVDEFAPAGPIPIQSLPEEARAPVRAEFAAYEEGFCVTTWFQDAGEYSPLVHQDASLPAHLNRLVLEARSSPSNRYLNVSRKFTTAAEEIFGRSAVAYLTGYFDNQTGRLLRATLNVVADDEIAVAVNDQAIFESFGWRPTARIAEKVLLPPGLSHPGNTVRAPMARGATARVQPGGHRALPSRARFESDHGHELDVPLRGAWKDIPLLARHAPEGSTPRPERPALSRDRLHHSAVRPLRRLLGGPPARPGDGYDPPPRIEPISALLRLRRRERFQLAYIHRHAGAGASPPVAPC